MSSAPTNRQKLLDIAVDLFSLNGYDGVSIRDLCRAVGIKESSFYNHFRGKDELLEEIFAEFHSGLRVHLPTEDLLEALLDAAEPLPFWLEVARRWRTALEDARMRKIHRILLLEQYRNPRARNLLVSEVLDHPRRLAALAFEKFIARGQVRPLDPAQMAGEFHLPFYALLLEILALDAEGQDLSPAFDRLEEHTRFFIGMVTTPASS